MGLCSILYITGEMHYNINANLLYLCQTTLKEPNSNEIYFVVLDIDECTKGTHSCHVNAVCNNIQGSYHCTCKDGFSGDGINYCTGINKNINLLILAFFFILILKPVFFFSGS